MAEGGIAAAMGNVWSDDGWKVHFRDTMRGGKMLNNWRMAQLHAQEAPDRVFELEEWGAVFDRTDDGRILQRDFGGHRFARLAHVGDRTGLELIRTLQNRVVKSRIDVYMESTVLRLMHGEGESGSGRMGGVFAYWRESGTFLCLEAPAVVLATGGGGEGGHGAAETPGENPGRAGAPARTRGPPNGNGVVPVPPPRPGLAPP